MSLEVVVILSLATWRIAHMIADDSEDGPWDVLHRLRYLIGVRYDEKNRPRAEGELAKALSCVWCSTVWVGAIVFLISHFVTPLIFYPFAISAGALITNKLVKR